MNAHHFNQLLSERLETFRHLSETALYPEVKEWADDCTDILEQVVRDFQKCSYEEPETDEEALNKHFYVGNKCYYVGEDMPEFRKVIWTINKVDTESVWVDFLENLPMRFSRKDVIPF